MGNCLGLKSVSRNPDQGSKKKTGYSRRQGKGSRHPINPSETGLDLKWEKDRGREKREIENGKGGKARGNEVVMGKNNGGCCESNGKNNWQKIRWLAKFPWEG